MSPIHKQLTSNRRSLLKTAALGFGNIAFTAMAAETIAQSGMGDRSASTTNNPLQQKTPHFLARAKRVIFLFMKGGPSHVDTFDPKPALDRDDGNPPPFDLPKVTFAKQGNLLRSPWKFRRHGESGLPVSALFPNVAKHADDLCILRSVHGTNPAHGGASYKSHTATVKFSGTNIRIFILAIQKMRRKSTNRLPVYFTI